LYYPFAPDTGITIVTTIVKNNNRPEFPAVRTENEWSGLFWKRAAVGDGVGKFGDKKLLFSAGEPVKMKFGFISRFQPEIILFLSIRKYSKERDYVTSQ